jgi:hypothetical protein
VWVIPHLYRVLYSIIIKIFKNIKEIEIKRRKIYMVEVTNDMLNDILKEAGGQYFFHKEDVGEVEVEFESPIEKFEPGEEDFAGRMWNPPVMDAQGNPILDFKGNPREPWAKLEAKCVINGAHKFYSFGGPKSKNLTCFIEVMNREGIANKDLPGTRWSINRVGKWDWDIRYLGRGDSSSSSSSSTIDNKVIDAIRAKKDQSTKEMTKNDFKMYIKLMTNIDIDDIWDNLLSDKLISEKDDKVLFL